MKDLYKNILSVIEDYHNDIEVQNLDFPRVSQENHLINLFKNFVNGYSSIDHQYFKGENVGLLITTNRIITAGNPNNDAKITITNDYNSYLYSVIHQTDAFVDKYNITVLRDKNLILFRIVDTMYPSEIVFKYDITLAGLERLQHIIIKHGYLPAFDPNYIALIPLSNVSNSKIEQINRRYNSNIKSLKIDTSNVNWVPMFVTANDVDIINEATISQIIDSVPPETINVDLDQSFIDILQSARPYTPELTWIFLQLAL